MADNTELATASGGDTIATDDIGGVKYPRTKLIVGIDGTNDGDVAATNPLPVDVISALPEGANAIGKLAANSGIDIGDVDILSIAPGDNNIGNVDIVTFPAGNLGQQLAAASQSVVPGTDIADATYIGDIKFGEALPDTAAGDFAAMVVDLAAIEALLITIDADTSKITACDTGAVVVASGTITTVSTVSSVSAVIPGVGATNLGKAIDTAAGATDTGVALLAIRDDALTTLTPVDGDYVGLRVNSTGALHVTGGGGGTAYTEDVATANPIVGTATLMERDDALTTVTPVEGDWIGIRGTAEGALWTQDFNSDAILSDTTSIDGKITACNTGAVVISSGTVTAVTAITNELPAGTQTIGAVNIAAAQTLATVTTVGTVSSVSAVIPGTGATNLGKAIDTAAGATDTGVAILAIRDDALTTLTPVDGDYVGLRVNSTGALHVTGGGGGTEYNVDDVAGAADTGTAMLAIRDDSLTTLTPADGDYARLRVNATGALHVTGGGGGTEYTEDVATANPIVGTATLMERDDALTTVTPVEGDWIGPRGTAEGALWTQDFNSDAILADTSSIDGKITACDTGAVVIASGTITAVTAISNALPAGANTIGAVNIAAAQTLATVTTVDTVSSVSAVIPGTGATNLGKAIDTAAGATDTGVAMLAIRDDALTTLTPVDGDYVGLRVNSTGALHVTGAGGGTQYTAGTDTYTETTTVTTIAGVVRSDAGGSLVDTDNEITALQVDASGALRVTGGGGGTEYTEDAAAAANPVGGALIVVREDARAGGLTTTDGDNVALRGNNSGELYVLDTDAKALLTTIDADTSTLAGAVTGTEMQVDVVASLPAGGNTIGGVSIATALPAGANTIGAVNIAPAQTLATVTTVSTLTTCTTLTGSSIAHDGADSGNPHKIGAKAAATLATKTLVAADDRTDLFAGTDGVLLTRSHCLGDVVQERTTNVDGASTAFTSGLAAPGAGIRLWIRNVTISNSSATFCTVDLRDGVAGSVLWTLPVPATGGVTMHFDPPLKLTANTALAFKASAATTTISISANGFKSKV